MKKSHIVLVILAAAMIGVLVTTFSPSISCTKEVFEVAFENPGKEYMVSGKLDKTAAITYDPEVDASRTVFSMVDNQGRVERVTLDQAKPQGLEQSESIDLYGSVVDGEFIASKILMKCPSKYNENQLLLDTAENREN
jgi:cytochrome c-type biogenesis protein CcmE